MKERPGPTGPPPDALDREARPGSGPQRARERLGGLGRLVGDAGGQERHRLHVEPDPLPVLGRHREEGLDDARVELGAAAADDLRARVLERPRLPVLRSPGRPPW